MNTQLTLLALPVVPAPIAADKPTYRRPHPSRTDREWWRLSREEKQRGLAGVRAIRAILEKHNPSELTALSQAS